MISSKRGGFYGKRGIPIVILFFFIFIMWWFFTKISFYNNIDEKLVFFQVADDVPQTVDVIFSFGGSNFRREKKAFFLFNKFENAIWVLSYAYPIPELEKILGGDIDSLRRVQIKNCRNTFEEVLQLKTFLDNKYNHGKFGKPRKDLSILLVSSDWHLKRIQVISKALLKDYQIYLIAANDERSEIEKLVFYKEEYIDMFIDWWRSLIWKITFGKATIFANTTIE